MKWISFQPLHSDEYAIWSEASSKSYAEANVISGRWPKEGAEAKAREARDQLLCDGLSTPGHYIWTLHSASHQVGYLWLHVQGDKAFVYDILIHPQERGNGWGRAAMLQLEVQAKQLGAASIGLHVFRYNEVAVGLYTSLGYEIKETSPVSQVMEKRLNP